MRIGVLINVKAAAGLLVGKACGTSLSLSCAQQVLQTNSRVE